MDAAHAAIVAWLLAAGLAMAQEPGTSQPRTLSPTQAVPLQPVPDPLADTAGREAVPRLERHDRSAVVPAAARGATDRPHPAAATATAGALVPVAARRDGDPLDEWRTLLEAAAATMDDRLPVSLADVLPGSSGAEAYQRVAAYWRFAAACARQGVYAAEHARLRELMRREGGAADPLLRSAVELAQAARRVADAQCRAAQESLRRWLPDAGSGNTAGLWPADVPHASGYQTRLAELFAGRTPPARAAFLDRALPLQQQLVAARAEAVAAASDALEAALSAWEQGSLPTDGLLRRVTDLRDERLSAIDALVDYNVHIAEYTTTVAGHVPSETLPRLLLKNPAPRQMPGAVLPHREPAPSPASVSPAVASPRPPQGAATPRRAFKPPAVESQSPPPDAATTADQGAQGDLQALAQLDAPQQAAALWQWLLWDEPRGTDPAVRRADWHELSETARRNDRAALHAAYVRVLQAQGMHRAAQQAHAQWQALYPVLLQQRTAPGGAEAMLDLRAVERHQAAEVLHTRAQLEAAQFLLARQAGLPPHVLRVAAVAPQVATAPAAASAGEARPNGSAEAPWPVLDETAAAAAAALLSADAWLAQCRSAVDSDPAAVAALRDAMLRHQQAVALFLQAALEYRP